MAERIDPVLSPLEQARQLMDILRGPNGCDWDQAQGFSDIAPYTIEEAYEVKDAIDRRDWAELEGELGDLLFQVLFHSRIAADEGRFNLDDVCRTLVAKMVARHPHVFADGPKPDWEEAKAQERTGRTLDGVALALPALQRAQKLQKRAAIVGFDWPNAQPVADKVREELTELANANTEAERHEELGDLLFAVVNLARHSGVDAEAALRDANAKFQRRFEAVEDAVDLTFADLDTMEAAWNEAKRRGL